MISFFYLLYFFDYTLATLPRNLLIAKVIVAPSQKTLFSSIFPKKGEKYIPTTNSFPSKKQLRSPYLAVVMAFAIYEGLVRASLFLREKNKRND